MELVMENCGPVSEEALAAVTTTLASPSSSSSLPIQLPLRVVNVRNSDISEEKLEKLMEAVLVRAEEVEKRNWPHLDQRLIVSVPCLISSGSLVPHKYFSV
jgi:hypothetical protein